MDKQMAAMAKEIKNNIIALVNKGRLDTAKSLISDYEEIIHDDVEVYSIKAVIAIMENKLQDAENLLKRGLMIDSNNFDLNYNLAYVYSTMQDYNQAFRYYKKSAELCKDENIKSEINDSIESILKDHKEEIKEEKRKIAFFVKQGMDSFLGDIIDGLSAEYEVKKIVITQYNQIDQGMIWADICWFEWCDELIIYGSKLEIAKNKKIICRLHRYEAFSNYPASVMWDNVDKLIIVTDHLKHILSLSIPDIDKKVDIVTIKNGVNLNKYKFDERHKGFNLAYVGYINSRKNPVLLLQIMSKLVKIDKRYKLFIAGQFQDILIKLYWDYQIKSMGLGNNIIFQGWQSDINKWLKDKQYILSTSIHESFGYGIAEAMSMGIKPIIHNFVYADEIWSKDYLFNTIDEAIDMLQSNEYDSKGYRKFIEDNYSLDNQIISIKHLLNDLCQNKFKDNLTLEYIIHMFNSFIPYSPEYIDKFNFEGCCLVIGKREMLSQDIDLIEFIIKNKYGNQLVLTNILFNKNTSKIIFPDYILCSKNEGRIYDLMNSSINLTVKSSNRIQGFIFDELLLKDVQENQDAYIWERGIPATQFMPALGYLRIIERYQFALNFIKQSDVILEAASGFGYGAAFFSNKCKQIYALDLAEENIKFSILSYDFENIKWINGDVTKLPFEDNKFDVYTSFETLEHLPIDIVNNYFKEAVRVLKSDGIMIISTPNGKMRKGVNNPFHVKEYNYSEFDEMLHKHFSNVHYYSVADYKVEDGIKSNSINMIAVCSNGGKS